MNIKEIYNNLKSNKYVRRGVLIALLVLFILFFLRYRMYKKAVTYYNLGVSSYNSGDYANAELMFRSALWEKHTKRQECKMRINEALSITTPITPESVNADNLDESIARLEEAKDILTANDCAHENDNKGHNKKAQTLKNEIDEYIEQLKQQVEEENKKEEEKDSKTDEQKEQERKEKEEKEIKAKEEEANLKDKFEKIEQEGLTERNSDLQRYREWNRKDGYYSGKSW